MMRTKLLLIFILLFLAVPAVFAQIPYFDHFDNLTFSNTYWSKIDVGNSSSYFNNTFGDGAYVINSQFNGTEPESYITTTTFSPPNNFTIYTNFEFNSTSAAAAINNGMDLIISNQSNNPANNALIICRLAKTNSINMVLRVQNATGNYSEIDVGVGNYTKQYISLYYDGNNITCSIGSAPSVTTVSSKQSLLSYPNITVSLRGFLELPNPIGQEATYKFSQIAIHPEMKIIGNLEDDASLAGNFINPRRRRSLQPNNVTVLDGSTWVAKIDTSSTSVNSSFFDFSNLTIEKLSNTVVVHYPTKIGKIIYLDNSSKDSLCIFDKNITTGSQIPLYQQNCNGPDFYWTTWGDCNLGYTNGSVSCNTVNIGGKNYYAVSTDNSGIRGVDTSTPTPVPEFNNYSLMVLLLAVIGGFTVIRRKEL